MSTIELFKSEVTHPDQQKPLPDELVAMWKPEGAEQVYYHECKDKHGYVYNVFIAYQVGRKVMLQNFIWFLWSNDWQVSTDLESASAAAILKRMSTLKGDL